jgi:hypothetical protein
MTDRTDYSGPYDHDLSFADFSKEFLIDLMHTWQYAYMRLSSIWYQEVIERFGMEAADKCNLAVWMKVGEKIVPKFARVGNIEFNSIADGLKTIQLAPDGHTDGELFEGEVDIKNDNHVLTTTTRCRVLEYLERVAPERIEFFCHVLEKHVMQAYFNNPSVTVTPLKLPPRTGPDEVCCRWEIKLES